MVASASLGFPEMRTDSDLTLLVLQLQVLVRAHHLLGLRCDVPGNTEHDVGRYAIDLLCRVVVHAEA